MKKLVYLQELDSVRKTKEEIEQGQQALFEEIVINGNIVVLTYNQLADSRAFTCALENEDTYKNIKQLFQNGAIKVSNFGNISTASHYVQNSIEKCKKGTYLFSGIPVKHEDQELLQAMEEAFMYSDPSKLDCFFEDTRYEKKNIELLQRYIRMMLFLSVYRPGNHPPKKEIRYGFIDYMREKIFLVDTEKIFSENAQAQIYYKEAVQLLHQLSEAIPQNNKNNRSYWVDSVKEASQIREKSRCMAEAIIHICYNYTMEESIADITKHYEEGNMKSFEKDYIYRLEKYWKEFEMELHQLPYVESNEWQSYEFDFPKWDTAERIIAADKSIYRKKQENNLQNSEDQSVLYEYNIKKERKKWSHRRIWLIARQMLNALLYVAVFCLIDWVMGNVEDIISQFLDVSISALDAVLVFLINALIFTVLLGIISSLISVFFKLPDILECIEAIGNCFRDAARIMKSPRTVAYSREDQE